eukprot:scaffold33792_cov90-Phaeocystis_antarctica.AAC.1
MDTSALSDSAGLTVAAAALAVAAAALTFATAALAVAAAALTFATAALAATVATTAACQMRGRSAAAASCGRPTQRLFMSKRLLSLANGTEKK